jgi:hypothetical protein
VPWRISLFLLCFLLCLKKNWTGRLSDADAPASRFLMEH